MEPTSDTERLRGALYESYATTHAGLSDGLAVPTLRRDIVERLPPRRRGIVLDVGCGQGELVRLLSAAGFNVRGVDISPEQVQLAHARGINAVELGDARKVMEGIDDLAAVTATDFFEHLTREENAVVFAHIAGNLIPGGRLVGRVPNASSPFGGNYRHGDVTHETWYTVRNLEQQLRVAGFSEFSFFACSPVAHSFRSRVRAWVWRFFSGFYKASLAVETGVLRGHIVTQNLVFVAVRS